MFYALLPMKQTLLLDWCYIQIAQEGANKLPFDFWQHVNQDVHKQPMHAKRGLQ